MADSDCGLVFDVDLVAEGGDNNFHIPNLPGEDFRRVLAQTTNAKSPLNTRISIIEVHHGSMVYEEEETDATLLILEFRFHSRESKHRYKSVSVTLEFFDKGGNARRDPAVVGLAPDHMHWLNKTTYDRRTKYSATGGVTAGPGIASGQVNASWEMEQTRPLKFNATLTGSPGRSKGKVGDENAVTWTMKENSDAADGIPSFLQTALLLKRRHGGGAFVAKLHVKSDVDFGAAGYRLFPVTTDEDKLIDPVAFTPGKVQVRNNKVTGIQPDDLDHLETVDLVKFFKVNMSEEDVLTPLVGAVASADNGAKEGGAPNKDAAARLASVITSPPPVEGVTGAAGTAAPAAAAAAAAADTEGTKDASGIAVSAPPAIAPAVPGEVVSGFVDGESATPLTGPAPAALVPTPEPTPEPAPERTLPLSTATSKLHSPPTPSPAPGPAGSPTPATASALAEAIASAANASELAAQAAKAAAEAARAAAEAAEAAARAAEAVVLAVSKLSLA